MLKKISIIIPVYNVLPAQLEKCVNSILQQTYQEFEVIMVDDGSTNASAKLCDYFAGIDGRIAVFHQENRGTSVARNKGLELSSGDYILFIDADDWIEINMLQDLMSYQLLYRDSVIMFGYIKEFDKKSVCVKVTSREKLFYGMDGKDSFEPCDMRFMGFITHTLYPANIIGTCRFQEGLANSQDIEFNFNVYPKIKKAVYINKHYYHYRQNNNSAVHKFDPEKAVKYMKTIRTVKKGLVKSGCKDLTAFYSFVAIIYISLMVNCYFSKNNSMKYAEKRMLVRKLGQEHEFLEMLSNLDVVKVPFSRKIVCFFGKIHFYFGIYLIVKVKECRER